MGDGTEIPMSTFPHIWYPFQARKCYVPHTHTQFQITARCSHRDPHALYPESEMYIHVVAPREKKDQASNTQQVTHRKTDVAVHRCWPHRKGFTQVPKLVFHTHSLGHV